MLKVLRTRWRFCEMTKKQGPNASKVLYPNDKFNYESEEAMRLQKEGFKSLFTNLPMSEEEQEQKTNFSKGRPWKAEELRLKSSQELHKLWYVCVREKNLLSADQLVVSQGTMHKNAFGRKLQKVAKTMNRIMTVVGERDEIKRKYRATLEDQYILFKKMQLEKKVKKGAPPLPPITWQMLRAKYQDLRRGVDNIKYLERIWDKVDIMDARKQRADQRVQAASHSQKFASFWEREMTLGERPTQQEILRMHIKNWKSLNLAQRRIILGFLNAKRSKDAKATFIKELKILSKQVAYEEAKDRILQSKPIEQDSVLPRK